MNAAEPPCRGQSGQCVTEGMLSCIKYRVFDKVHIYCTAEIVKEDCKSEGARAIFLFMCRVQYMPLALYRYYKHHQGCEGMVSVTINHLADSHGHTSVSAGRLAKSIHPP